MGSVLVPKTQSSFDLTCGHCHAIFSGSYKRWYRAKTGGVTYCSDFCRFSAQSKNFKGKISGTGEQAKPHIKQRCQQCGNEFESKSIKPFCNMKCYTSSPRFKDHIKKILAEANSEESIAKRVQTTRTGVMVNCLECDLEFYQKPANKGHHARKFCCRSCYRAYFSKRFDRWIANPEDLALPQCYDEFLDREELTCLVPGCNWSGNHLSLHMNQVHGVVAKEAKRAAGFNLSSGLISKSTARKLQLRGLQGVAIDKESIAIAQALAKKSLEDVGYLTYKSLEGREHRAKSMALLASGVGKKRTCLQCHAVFFQKTPCGKAKYCSLDCRGKFYKLHVRGGRLDSNTIKLEDTVEISPPPVSAK